MKQSKVNPYDFRDVFGVSLSEIARECGFTKQGLFQNLNGEWKSDKFPFVVEHLKSRLDEIHKADLRIAEYKYLKGKKILEDMENLI